MSRKTGKVKARYSDEPMKTGKRVKDFLPPPEELAFKDDAVKVTISERSPDGAKRHPGN